MLTSQRLITIPRITKTPHLIPTILTLITSSAPAILTTIVVNHLMTGTQNTCTPIPIATTTQITITPFQKILLPILTTIANQATVITVKSIVIKLESNSQHRVLLPTLFNQSSHVRFASIPTLMMAITTLTLNLLTHPKVAAVLDVTPTLTLMIPTPQMMDPLAPPMTTHTTLMDLTTMTSSQTITTSSQQVMTTMVHSTTTGTVPLSVTCTSATKQYTTSKLVQVTNIKIRATQVQLEDLEFENKERI